jgi:ribosomal protein L11 methyltransferase
MEAGALSVSIEDRDAGTEAEAPQFGEPGLDDPKAWRRNWVVALLEADADVPALIARLGLPADVEHAIEAVPEQDWVRLTQSQFDPIPISDRLWIVPSWHEPPTPRPSASNWTRAWPSVPAAIPPHDCAWAGWSST